MDVSNNKIRINGREVNIIPGDTILDVANKNGIDIPTMCFLKRANPTGACRICVVEVEGYRNLVPSCATEAKAGMVIHTESEKVVSARKMIIELMLSDGWHDCLICEQSGACKLQDLAYRYRIGMPRFERQKKHFVYDTSHPLIVRDFSKCVLCGRCVQACNEIQVNNVLSVANRGSDSTIVASFNKPLGSSECVACGECVQACPVGALIEKKPIGKARNWETKKIRTTCPYCGVGCQMYLHVKNNKIIKVTGVEDARPNEGNLCVKGRFGYDFVSHPERLKKPLIKQKDGSFKEVSWREALSEAAERLKKIKDTYGPDAIAGIGSSRASNEDNYSMMKFMRSVIGTNNIDNCART